MLWMMAQSFVGEYIDSQRLKCKTKCKVPRISNQVCSVGSCIYHQGVMLLVVYKSLAGSGSCWADNKPAPVEEIGSQGFLY